ncbi:MAG: hypothetical protein ACXAB2_05160 [Candidatus Hodarchaeales archaeon]|jgi:hypothetical protein
MKIKNKTKPILAVILVSSMLGMMFFPISAIAGEITNPIPVDRPVGIMQNQMHSNLIGLLRGMESANFTPDNVYYGVYSNKGSYSYPLSGSNERNVSLNLEKLTYVINQSRIRLSNDVSTDPQTSLFLTALLSELESHSTVDISHKIISDLTITTTHNRKAVTIFYDNDRSVIDSIEIIINNDSVQDQIFTGDEVLTNIIMSRVRDEVTGTYKVRNKWTYEDGTDSILLKRFIEMLSSRKWLTKELDYFFNLGTVNIMRSMVGPNDEIFSSSVSDPKVLERGTFSISQLKIDSLSLQKMDNRLMIQEYDYTYLEHHLLGTLVYNDTNSNGYMDIGVKTLPVGLNTVAYPSIGNEALYRFDMKSIGTQDYDRPVTFDNVLEFGSSFTDVQGYLQPLENNQDISLFNVSTGVLHNIDEVTTQFHFEVDNDIGEVTIKFDYLIGEWDNSVELEGLSLNQMMVSTVVDAQNRKTIRWRNENNSDLNEEFENSSRISRFRFADSTSEFAEIRLDDIPYLWNKTESVNATGQLIPMNLFNVAYGAISSEADLIRSMRGSTSRKTFIYSVSYPKWDGKEILHDPAYSVLTGIAAESENTDGAPIPGFELVSLLLAIPVVVLLKRKRD